MSKDTPNYMLERAVARLDEAVRSLAIATNHGSYASAKRELQNVRARVECYSHYLFTSKDNLNEEEGRV